MSVLTGAAARAVTVIADADRRLVLVSGSTPTLTVSRIDSVNRRRVIVPGRRVRAAVGIGAALGGRPVCVELDDPDGLAAAPWPLARAVVALTADMGVATSAHRAGLTVVQPAWPADVEPLIRQALAAAAPVCLALHAGDAVAAAGDPAGQISLGQPRVLRRGGPVTIAASGSLTVTLGQASRMLAGRGFDVTALDLPVLPGIDAARSLLGDCVLLGTWDGQPSGLGTLRPVAVPTRDPRALMTAILGQLPAEAQR